MGGRGRPTRIVCVNCNICVNNLRRYPALQLDTRVTALLCNWVYPLIITEDDCVCEACRDLAMFRVNINLQQEVSGSDDQQSGPSHRGHTNVCLLCGCSTLHRQSDRILRDNPTELQQSMINIIESRVAPRQITASDSVCHACWLRTQREVRRVNLLDDARSQPGVAEESQVEPQPSGSNQTEPNSMVNTQGIVLPDYRRAANSNNRCVFPSCDSSTLHGISDKLRALVLHNHNYYLPKLARVCGEHSMSNSWETLYDSENSIETFTAEQIQHVFSFVNKFNPTLDFDQLEEMDDRVFEYWIGLTKEKFNSLLIQVPRILELQRGSLGLATLLLKMRTGDSDDRIATLVKVPRRTLESLMDKVREILLQDFVPRNLGITQLRREELLRHNLLIPNELYGTRTSFFQSITADRNNLLYFPTLEHRDLILFALGTYQIRQARSYYGEHIRFHGGYKIEVCSERIETGEYNLRGSGVTTLIRGKIMSRHISRRQYYVYIVIENNIPGRRGITEYCCSCLVGRRTVGCCAHTMTLIWYLGWARHQQNITAPAEFLDHIIIREDDDE